MKKVLAFRLKFNLELAVNFFVYNKKGTFKNYLAVLTKISYHQL